VPAALIEGEDPRGWAARQGWAVAGDSLEVEGTDVITAVSGVCPDRTLIIRGVPVTLNGSTAFDGVTCSTLAAGQRVQVRGILTALNGVISVLATRIRLEDHDDGDDEDGKVAGVIADTTGTCPNLTITLEGVPNTVVTTAATQFPDGPCTELIEGVRITAEGSVNPATQQLNATRIEVEDDDDGPDNGGGRPLRKGEGPVGSVSGTCPTLLLNIQGARVRTTRTTEYQNGACDSLRPGTKVSVEALENGDGTFTATFIRIVDQPGGGKVAGEGRVDSVDGSCPSLTLVVRGYTVVTTGSTEFAGGPCTSIRRGTRIEARGDLNGTTLTADLVRIR
jgi:hypothetical protein